MITLRINGEDRSVDAAYEASEAVGAEDGAERVKGGSVMVLGSYWKGRRVGLHASFDEEEGIAEGC